MTPEEQAAPTLMYSTDESIEGIAIRALIDIAQGENSGSHYRTSAAESILAWVQYRESNTSLTHATNSLNTIAENISKLTER